MIMSGLVLVVDNSSPKAPGWVDPDPSHGTRSDMHHEHSEPKTYPITPPS